MLPLGLGMGRLDGKVAVVTGGARGLGRAMCVRLAEDGADIASLDVLTDIETVPYPSATEEDMAETVRLVEASDRNALPIRADVRDAASLDAAVEQIRERFGRIDIVCPNAGILSHATGWEMTEEEWLQMIDIALNGAWRTAKAAIPTMIAGGRGGSIVFTSSVVGLKGAYGLAHYAAAKHGVIGVARTLAIELAEHSIRVNTINPGTATTTLTINEPTAAAFVQDKENPTFEDLEDVYGELSLLPVKMLDPADVANAVAWLCSDEARYVTGVSLPVDAGTLTK